MIGVPVFQEVSTGLVYCQFVELASDVVFGQECTDALIQTVVVQKWVLESVGCDLPGFSDCVIKLQNVASTKPGQCAQLQEGIIPQVISTFTKSFKL